MTLVRKMPSSTAIVMPTRRQLQSWIETVLTSGLPDLQRFATGLQHDAAVRAALELPYSNGQTEGQVTRLKLLKRQMYGRASFDLLRKRLLLNSS